MSLEIEIYKEVNRHYYLFYYVNWPTFNIVFFNEYELITPLEKLNYSRDCEVSYGGGAFTEIGLLETVRITVIV